MALSRWTALDDGPVLDTTVAGIVRQAAERDPDAPALVEGIAGRPDARRRWTYSQLRTEAESAAGALARRFGPGERVAAWAP
ncbi:MAG TPA: AMP-binding protein, partial [Acidimicrobiales bacterium]|nr:AMP-binding protein [Acidimicrobiales bacterium]